MATIQNETILDETRDFVARYVSASNEQLDAMALYAAATHAMKEFVTFGRLLFWSHDPESGKTVGMDVTSALSANPIDADGTSYALQSTLAAATNTPEVPIPTLYRDEISDVFGKSGTNGTSNPVGKILRKGYKRGATDSRSVNGVTEHYGIFTPFIMCGLRTAVPSDIRSRSVAIQMFTGKPSAYFDVREGEPMAKQLAKSIAATVKASSEVIATFRARGVHKKMVGRKLEIWEPLLAVAYALGGQAWLNRAVRAFEVLALSDSESDCLSPRQAVLKQMSDLINDNETLVVNGFVGGLALADELARIDSPLYEGRSIASLACLIRDTMPVDATRRRVNRGAAVRGYTSREIHDSWDAARPADADDSVIEDEYNPFED